MLWRTAQGNEFHAIDRIDCDFHSRKNKSPSDKQKGTLIY